MGDAIQAYVFTAFFVFVALGGVASFDDEITWPDIVAGAALWPLLLVVLLAIGLVRGWRRMASGELS